MADRKTQDQDKFVLRLPDGMRDRIKAAAESNNRSMNAEIVVRLENSFVSGNPETVRAAALLEHILGQHISSSGPEVLERTDSVVLQIHLKRSEVATDNRTKDFGVADDNAKPATAAEGANGSTKSKNR